MESPSTHAVASAVRKAMVDRGVSQLELSNATMIPRATLIRRLHGAQPFTVPELTAVAAYLGVRASALLDEAVA
jgi:transcriptional regulator with XRE-family HTH domain